MSKRVSVAGLQVAQELYDCVEKELVKQNFALKHSVGFRNFLCLPWYANNDAKKNTQNLL